MGTATARSLTFCEHSSCRSYMCRHWALRRFHVVLFVLVVEIGVMRASIGHCDPMSDCQRPWRSLGRRVMCADIGHCDRSPSRRSHPGPVGVMCADIGHCDPLEAPLLTNRRFVGVMCADIGHCDFLLTGSKNLSVQ